MTLARPATTLPAPRRRASSRLRRATALLALTAAVGAAGVGCSKTDQVATDQSTTVAPATAKPAADAAGTGSTLGTTPGTQAGTSTTAKISTTTTTKVKSPVTTGSMVTVAPTIPQETSSTVAGSAADVAFCAKGAEIENTLKGIDPTSDAAGALAKYKQVFADLAAAAPPEVQADMEQINTVIQSMTNFDSPPADADKLDAAGKRVDTWAVAHCGKKFGGS